MLETAVKNGQESATSLNSTELRILEAAEREFMIKGYAGARTTVIAEGAGVTHAMLNYYFRSKEKLFNRIISEKIAMVTTLMSESMATPGRSLNQVIKQLIDTHLDFIAANPLLPQFVIMELNNGGNPANFFFKTLKRYALPLIIRLQSKIDDEAKSGHCRAVDAKIVMLDIVSLNILPFLIRPALNAVGNNIMADLDAFVIMRKRENFHTIMSKLKH